MVIKVINKNASWTKLIFAGTLSVETDFVKILFVVNIILSHVVNESSIILSTYSPFLQLHAAGFQQMITHTQFFLWFLHSHWHL